MVEIAFGILFDILFIALFSHIIFAPDYAILLNFFCQLPIFRVWDIYLTYVHTFQTRMVIQISMNVKHSHREG